MHDPTAGANGRHRARFVVTAGVRAATAGAMAGAEQWTGAVPPVLRSAGYDQCTAARSRGATRRTAAAKDERGLGRTPRQGGGVTPEAAAPDAA
jgi:hypothetical protein